MICGITGYNAGNGPFISIHDGFQGTAWWTSFVPDSDHIILHTHPCLAFDGAPNELSNVTSKDPLEAGGIWPKQACSSRGPLLTTRCGFAFFSGSAKAECGNTIAFFGRCVSSLEHSSISRQ
jgi:hypothetical protein